MTKLLAILPRLLNRQLTFLANKSEGAATLVELVSTAVLTHLSNEAITARRGVWVEIAPYGRHRHSAGMQVFERDDAVEMVRDFANSRKFKMLGLPWYIGHPDHPLFKDRYKDGGAYGRIKELRPGISGLEARVRFNKKGVHLVNEETFDGHSPNWGCIRDAVGNYRPRKLSSVGWTNEPNINVQPVMASQMMANEDLTTTKSMNIQHVKETLLASGLIKPGASDEDVTAAVMNLANEIPGLKADAAKVAGLETELTTVKASLQETETNLANEKIARCGMVVDVAIKQGRVETGKRESFIQDLANEANFEEASKAILEAEPKFKTASKTGELGGRSTDGENKGQQITALCNEKIASNPKLTWDQAYNSVKASHKNLFEA